MNFWNQFLILTKDPIFPQVLNIINVVLIFLTGLVTYLSWRTAKKANELQLLPLLSIYFRGTSTRDRKIRIRNIGKSPAYNIKIASFTILITDVQKVWKLDLRLTGTNVLVPEEERDLTLIGTSNGKRANMEDYLVLFLDPDAEHERNRISLVMTFTNAEGNNYYSQIETGVGGLFIKPARRLDICGKLYLYFRRSWDNLIQGYYKFKWKFTQPYIKQPKRSG